MREIKFRGKDKFTNAWKFGDFSHSKGVGEQKDYDRIMVGGYEVLTNTVGVFTGFADKNEKDIYEGDILSFTIFDYFDNDKQFKGVVKFCNGMFEIWHDNDSEFYGGDGAFLLGYVYPQDDELEVIGNIYDNPDILEIDEKI